MFIALKALTRIAILCSRAKFQPNQESIPVLKRAVDGDASEAAILKRMQIMFSDVMEIRKRNKKVAEIPFSSVNKYQVSTFTTKTEIRKYCKIAILKNTLTALVNQQFSLIKTP